MSRSLAFAFSPVAEKSRAARSSRAVLNKPIWAKLRTGPVDDPLEREADAIADRIVTDNKGTAGSYFEPRYPSPRMQIAHAAAAPVIQRKPLDAAASLAPFIGEDPIHDPLIADYRRRHGLPPGGVDEFGNPAGPSDAEIKYRLAPGEFLPPCPEVKSEASLGPVGSPEFRKAFMDTNCMTAASQSMPPACAFTPTQDKLLTDAQKEAATRVKRALDRITAGGLSGKSFARELAKRVFTDEGPTVAETLAMLNGVSGFLSGPRIDFAGRTCGDPNCQRLPVVAYVKGPGDLPINICPLAFSDPAALARTILHESLHWSGLDADPATPEGYCEKFDCMSPCQDKTTADAWAHYLDCLGQPLELGRKSFIGKTINSADEIP